MKVEIVFTNDGIEKSLRVLSSVASPEQEAMSMRALYRKAHGTLAKAVGYTPRKTGALRATGRVDVDFAAREVTIRFGGPLAPYAVAVHEITTNHHPVGQAKFLERALIEDTQALLDAVAEGYTKVKIT